MFLHSLGTDQLMRFLFFVRIICPWSFSIGARNQIIMIIMIKKIFAEDYFSRLGGLNHLIASRAANYDWPFGTLPFGLFGSNLDTRDLETYPRTYSGHFWNMSILTIPGPFEYFWDNGWSQKIKVFLNEGAIVTPLIDLVLGGEVPRLNHGPICCPIQNT